VFAEAEQGIQQTGAPPHRIQLREIVDHELGPRSRYWNLRLLDHRRHEGKHAGFGELKIAVVVTGRRQLQGKRRELRQMALELLPDDFEETARIRVLHPETWSHGAVPRAPEHSFDPPGANDRGD